MTDSLIMESLKRVLAYIEENLESRLSLEAVTSEAYMSKFHFHRVFKRITSKSLMEYVRSRQLSKSAEKLLQTSLRASDIAMDFGFEHYQSFSRSFFNEFQCTPNEFRAGTKSIRLTEPLNLAELTSLDQGLMVKPETALLPDMTLMGVRCKICHEENERDYTAAKAGKYFYTQERLRITSHSDKDSYFGLTHFKSDFTSGYSYYLPSISVPPDEPTPEGMEKELLKSNKYAVFTYVGSHSPHELSFGTLESILMYVANWSQQTGYWNQKSYVLEHIPFELCSDDYCEMEVCLPL
ncbi:MAG: AraC family transcriptional regulator [Clostridia bacterium]|nr:AraC family transcriptional regulator [Clostridia bacterium]